MRTLTNKMLSTLTKCTHIYSKNGFTNQSRKEIEHNTLFMYTFSDLFVAATLFCRSLSFHPPVSSKQNIMYKYVSKIRPNYREKNILCCHLFDVTINRRKSRKRITNNNKVPRKFCFKYDGNTSNKQMS